MHSTSLTLQGDWEATYQSGHGRPVFARLPHPSRARDTRVARQPAALLGGQQLWCRRNFSLIPCTQAMRMHLECCSSHAGYGSMSSQLQSLQCCPYVPSQAAEVQRCTAHSGVKRGTQQTGHEEMWAAHIAWPHHCCPKPARGGSSTGAAPVCSLPCWNVCACSARQS